MSADWVNDINRMQTKYGVREWISQASPFELRKYLEFRLKFIKEEYDETKEAIIMHDSEEIVDGLIDICVVAIGTLDAMGVNAHTAWDEVLEANMAKEIGVKESRPNPLGIPDLIKPEGWTAPSHEDNHGIIPTAFDSDMFDSALLRHANNNWGGFFSPTEDDDRNEETDADQTEYVGYEDAIKSSNAYKSNLEGQNMKEKYGRAVETMPELIIGTPPNTLTTKKEDE
tara:strand:- start:1976 stop:2659 length:684 start_codon:yes stop_codon:yes gene_type:complete